MRVDLAGLPACGDLGDTQPPAVWQADMRLSMRGLPVVLSEQRADQYTPIQLNDELQQRQDSPDHPVPLVTTFLLDPNAQPGSAPDQHRGRARYSITLQVGNLAQNDRSFDFKEHLEQVADWADTAIFDIGPNDAGDGLQAWAAWNSQFNGVINQVDPITSNPCEIARTADGHFRFELPLPATAQGLTILRPNANLLVTMTDRDQATAESRGTVLAQEGVRSDGG